MRIESTAFSEGSLIPRRHTCDGKDVSPPLSWSGVPEGAKSLALICDDPDAPGKTWVHWVLFNLPSGTKELPEGVPALASVSGGGVQGINDFRKVGYGGPCPPKGTHRYMFRLYALDAELALPAGATKAELEGAIEGHVLGQVTLTGKYSRG